MKAVVQLCLPGCGVGFVAATRARELASEVSGSRTPSTVSSEGAGESPRLDKLEEGRGSILPEATKTKAPGRKSRSKRPSQNSFADLLEQRRQEVQSSQHEWWTYKFAIVVSWVVLALFTMASLLLIVLWARHEHEESFVVTFFVMAIAAMAYLAKVTGLGEAVIGGRKVPVIRYIDWIATTPLMLFELCMIGGAEKHTTILVIGSDLMMLVGGIVSAMLVPKEKVMQKYLWFSISVFFYMTMIAALEVDVAYGTVLDRPADVQRLFSQLSWLTVISWTGYPIVVLLGQMLRAQLVSCKQGE